MWTEGARRLALVCWRLRWLHALARLAEPSEARRLRHEARAAIKRHAPAAPEAFVHFARLEADVVGGAAGARAATAALRAALRDEAAPPERALFAARVVAELQEGGAGSAPARWALCCAALRRPLPPDEELRSPPPAPLAAAALGRCAERCAELERGFAEAGEDEEEDDVCAALLPGAGEWAAARAALAPAAERARLLSLLLRDRRLYRVRLSAFRPSEGGREVGPSANGGSLCRVARRCSTASRRRARWRWARRAARVLPRRAAYCPCSLGTRCWRSVSTAPPGCGRATLGLNVSSRAAVCAGAPLWAGAPAPAPSARAALAAVLPRLLRAPLAPDADPAGEFRPRVARHE